MSKLDASYRAHSCNLRTHARVNTQTLAITPGLYKLILKQNF